MPLPSITITGNVVDDPELRFTPSGKAVVNFRVAANQRKKTEAGGWVDGDSCFLTVNAWEDKAEAIAELVQRGSKVIVTGTLKQRDYEDREGNKRSAFEVQAYDVALVVQRPKAEREKPAAPSQDDPWGAGGVDPWAKPADTEPPF
jgi:single-strand DNA-binding protein